jgi:hypothetical protein
MRRSTSAIALSLLLAVALGACGSSTTSVTDHNATATAPHTQNTSTGQPTTPTTPTTATGTTTTNTNTRKQTPACVASMLKLGYIGGQGATGHGELGFSLTNTSGASCHTYGYPGVQFLTASGGTLPTKSTRTTQDFFGTTSLQTLNVAPGSAVSFRLGVTHGAGSSAGCVSAGQLQVIPPDDTHTLVLTIPNGGAYECGTATVSPLQPGTSAFR